MDVVQGKNVLLEVWQDVTSAFIPYICATDVSITFTPELINKTTKSSGRGNEYKTRRIDWTISLSGISAIVGDGRKIFETLTLDNIFKEEKIRMTFEDDGGQTSQFTGSVLLKSATVTGKQTDLSGFDEELQGTGTHDLVTVNNGGVTPPPTNDYNSDWWNVVDGSMTVSGLSAVKGLSLVGVEVLEVVRSGDEYDLVNAAPGNRQVRHDSVAGSLEFNTALNAGETVFVLIKT